jgi:opacity protein-like surface antigen
MNMKKNLSSVSLLVCALVSGAACADFCPEYYVGGEVQANKYRGTKELKTPAGRVFKRTDNKALFGNSGSGGSIIAGTKFNENVGIEVGATGLSKTKFRFTNRSLQTSSLKTKNSNLYADLLGYLPVCEEIDLIGSLGVGRLSTKIRGTVEQRNVAGRLIKSEHLSMKSSKAGARVGAGIGYNFDKNLSARLMFRHQKGNKYIKSVNSAGLGLFYKF